MENSRGDNHTTRAGNLLLQLRHTKSYVFVLEEESYWVFPNISKAIPPKNKASVVTKVKRTRDAAADPSYSTLPSRLGSEMHTGSTRYNTRSRKQLVSYDSDSDDSIDVHSTPSSSPTKSDASETSSTSLKEFLDAQELVYNSPRQKVTHNTRGYLEDIGDLKPKDLVVMFPRPIESPTTRMLRRLGPYLEVFIVILCAVCLGNYIVKHYL